MEGIDQPEISSLPLGVELPSLAVVQDPAIGNINPRTGEPLEPVPFSSEQEVFWAVDRCRVAFKEWGSTAFDDRANLVTEMVEAIVKRREEVVSVIAMETGRHETDILGSELAGLIDYCRSAIKVAQRALRHEQVAASPLKYLTQKTIGVEAVPRGVIGIIGSWNYPLATFFRSLFPALLSGNTVVLKPSEYAPRTGGWLASVAQEVLPRDVVTVVQGDPKIADSLFSAGIDAIAFSGTVETGERIHQLAAEHMIPSSLELSGRDSAIVLADCDLERTVSGIARYALGHSGQGDGSVEKVYVEASIADQFVKSLVKLVTKLRVGTEQFNEFDIGPLQSSAQVVRALEHIDEAIQQGAKLRCGGRRVGRGFSILPTVLDHCKENMKLIEREILGPVVCILRVNSGEEALQRANSSPYGLNGSVWTEDLQKGQALARRMNVGVAMVNNHSISSAMAEIPWGGSKRSGTNTLGSRHAYQNYVKYKTLMVDHSRWPEAFWYPIDKDLKKFLEFKLELASGAFHRAGALVNLLRKRVKTIRRLL